MADENTEGSRKRKSTSGDSESTVGSSQENDVNKCVEKENVGDESFEPSAKCQKTSTNLENSLDTKTTVSVMKLNENAEENKAESVENAAETARNDEEINMVSENIEENPVQTVENVHDTSSNDEKTNSVYESEVENKDDDKSSAHEKMVDLETSPDKINNEALHANAENLTQTKSEILTPINTLSNNDENSDTITETSLKQLDDNQEISTVATPNDLKMNLENQLKSTIPLDVNSSQLESTPATGMHINDEDDIEMPNDENFDDGASYEHDGRDTCGFPPIITITFSNNDSITYKPAFLNFIQNFTDLNVVELNNVIHLFKSETPDLPDVANSKANRNKRKKKAKKELFIVDTNPTMKEEEEIDKVKFNCKFKVLEEEEQDEEAKVSSPAGLSMCFNCEGNHAIKNCPLPKDFAKIRMARQKFKNNAAMKSARYHVEEEQKFAHLKPGRTSAKLREALGLGKYEIPVHVYKMRVLGYPPGWLEEAKIVPSNMSMFDIEGKFVKDKDLNKKEHIDPDKIINYPGFNVEMERGFRDQYSLHGVPKFSQSHGKEAMIKFINNMYITMEDNLETCDMDIDNSSDKEESTPSCTSPTLTDLEIKKKQLLAELVGNNSNSGETEATPENKKEEVNNGDKISDESNGDTIPINHVKQSVIGTPILKSASPYARLPKADNFMKDVSPVINFENLPNSTGKYEQMTGVLEKVRKTLKNIQEKT